MEFLRANYAAGDHEAFVCNVLNRLPTLLPSDLTAYCEIDPVAQTSRNWLDRPEVDTPEAARIWEHHMLEMPVVAHYVESHDGQALRITDFMSQRQFRDTGVYCEHYKPKNLEYVMATWVPSKKTAIGIGVSRTGRDYSDRERQILDLLRTHLVQGWRNAHALERLGGQAKVARALAALHPETIVLDAEGKPLFVGELARMRLAAYGTPAGRGQLPEELLAWARTLHAQLRQAETLARFAPMVIRRPDATIVVRPVIRGSGVVLIVEDRRSHSPSRAKMLGLTPREDEVLHWVIEGKSNADIGAILRVGEKTIEKHLEHIYAKLDVPNRAAAVTAALTVMPTVAE